MLVSIVITLVLVLFKGNQVSSSDEASWRGLTVLLKFYLNDQFNISVCLT